MGKTPRKGLRDHLLDGAEWVIGHLLLLFFLAIFCFVSVKFYLYERTLDPGYVLGKQAPPYEAQAAAIFETYHESFTALAEAVDQLEEGERYSAFFGEDNSLYTYPDNPVPAELRQLIADMPPPEGYVRYSFSLSPGYITVHFASTHSMEVHLVYLRKNPMESCEDERERVIQLEEHWGIRSFCLPKG